LLAQLEDLKLGGTPSQKLGNIKTQPAKQSDTVTYELTYWPEQAHLMQVSRVADLEHRLHKLETVLGATSDKMVHSASLFQLRMLNCCRKSSLQNPV
jgi:Dynamitin.